MGRKTKLSLLTDNMTVYAENLKESRTTKNSQINKQLQQGCRIQGYDIQKSITFLYTNHEHVEFTLKNTILLILTTKKIKY